MATEHLQKAVQNILGIIHGLVWEMILLIITTTVNLILITVDMLPPDEKTLKTYGSDENYDIYNFKILRNGFQNQVSQKLFATQ